MKCKGLCAKKQMFDQKQTKTITNITVGDLSQTVNYIL